MICSSCGAQRPDGDRFCGLCGIPLPHRPLSTLGAEGTSNLSRGPLETSSSHERLSTAVVGLLDLLEHNNVSLASKEPRDATLAPEAATSHISSQPPAESIKPEPPSLDSPPELVALVAADHVSSDELVSDRLLDHSPEAIHHSSAGQEEMAATDAPVPEQLGVSKFLEESAATPDEPTKSSEAPHFPWMDDVLDDIEHEATRSSALHEERPRFLDLLGDLSQPARDRPDAAVVAPSLSAEAEAPVASRKSRIAMVGDKPLSRKQRVWMATAAVLVFGSLAIVQWRNQFADNSKHLEQRITEKILELAARDDTDKNQPAASADPVDLNNSPSQSQPSTNAPQEHTVANESGPAALTKDSSAPVTKSSQPTGTAAQAQTATAPAPTPDKQEAPAKSGPGAQEMMRAEQAKTPAVRSEWLWKATAKGNPDAPVQLADMYVAGNGVPRSCEQAIVLLKTAALDNNARACDRLASMYTTGTCVPRSQLEAYRWLSTALAADPGNQSARHDRDTIWQQLTPQERSLAQGAR